MSTVTRQPAHANGQEQRHVQTLLDSDRLDRDSQGRFAKGNAGGPGNSFNRRVAALRQQVVDALTPERMGRIIEAVAQKAERGDLAAAKLLWQYGMGKPAPAVQPDRMDIEELALYQEQELSPEAWVKIIHSVPAEMAVEMLRPLMPVLNQSAAKHLLEMAKQAGIEVSDPGPSVTGDNGDQTPMGTGVIGEPKPSVNGGNGPQAPVANGGNGHEPLAKGDNGQAEGAASAISLVPACGTGGAYKKRSKKERRMEALRLRRLKAKWGLP